MEKLWRHSNIGRAQGFLQWKRGYTRAWRWISFSQGHREHCHGMSPSLQHLITIRLKAVLFNITTVQAYAPISNCDDNKIEEFCDQLQNVIDQTPKKDILLVQGDWNAKVGRDVCGNWQGICGPFCNDDTNERGLKLLEFASFNDLVFANTFGHHKASRGWTWHSPKGQTTTNTF